VSEKFFEVANKEVREDISSIQKILESCKNDEDVASNGNSIEKHLHKIKGLAPMMNQQDVGDIAQSADTIFKHIIANGLLEVILSCRIPT